MSGPGPEPSRFQQLTTPAKTGPGPAGVDQLLVEQRALILGGIVMNGAQELFMYDIEGRSGLSLSWLYRFAVHVPQILLFIFPY